jgi:glycosyltransferase involved in cell wall biosynthesis
MRQRIGRYYGRDARVLPPPVDLDRFAPVPGAKEYFLCLSALMPYKRVDLAVEACTRLRVPLRVVGSGTEDQRLRAMAGPTVKFVNSASDAEVQGLYAHCRALLFPAADDFGITSLEAQAAGRPVVAFREGGALETVLDGQTGVFFDQQSADCLAATLSSTDFDSFDPHTIRRNAESYAPAAFRARFRNYVQEVVARFNREGDE